MLVPGPPFKIADISSSTGFTAAQLVPTTGAFTGKHMAQALVQARTKSVYFNFGATDATSDHLLINDGDYIMVGSDSNLGVRECAGFRAIESAATGTLHVQPYYRV